jgi:hypothetical protein
MGGGSYGSVWAPHSPCIVGAGVAAATVARGMSRVVVRAEVEPAAAARNDVVGGERVVPAWRLAADPADVFLA